MCLGCLGFPGFSEKWLFVAVVVFDWRNGFSLSLYWIYGEFCFCICSDLLVAGADLEYNISSPCVE